MLMLYCLLKSKVLESCDEAEMIYYIVCSQFALS